MWKSANAAFSEATDYNSHNTERLDVEGMKRLLLKLEFIRDIRDGKPAQPTE